jgi:GntR family transcriptional regulator, transcriptional repressor for pyruvate dehydrogenase complex
MSCQLLVLQTKNRDTQTISGRANVAVALSRVCHVGTKVRENPEKSVIPLCDSAAVGQSYETSQTLPFRISGTASKLLSARQLGMSAALQELAPQQISPRFERVQVMPAYKAVSGVIEQRIVSGELKPGTQMPTEQELAEQFGVNRSTVREAIRQLEQEGLIKRLESKRMQVTMPGVHDAAPRAARALLLHQVTFEELWQVALVLEPQAARLAAAAASSADIAELQDSVGRLSAHYKADGSVQTHAELDIEFHALVARIAGNRALMLAREPINLLYRPSLIRLQEALPQMERRNLEAHKRIVKAIAARDADQAHEWTRKHLIDFQRGYAMAGIPMNSPLQAHDNP